MAEDRIIRTIKVKTKQKPGTHARPPKSHTQNNFDPTNAKFSKDTSVVQKVELSKDNMSELDRILSETIKTNKSSLKDASNVINNSVYDTKSAIDTQSELLKTEVDNTTKMLGVMKGFGDLLKAKIGHELGGSKAPAIFGQDGSLLASITTAITQIEKFQMKKDASAMELNSSIKELLEHNENATECAVIPEDHPIHEELEQQTRIAEEKHELDRSEQQEKSKSRIQNLRLTKIAIGALGFVTSLLGKVVKTLFRFSVSAAIAAAKWGAILFALVFGFDLISRYMKFWFNKFNTSLESFDEALGVMAPTMESLFNSFDELREYFIDGDYWSMFSTIFSGLIDVLWAGLSASSVMVSKMVGGLLRKLGADETADSMEAGILKEFAKQQNYRYSDADAEVIARADARTAEAFIKETKKRKWSDDEAAIQYQKKHGIQTNYVDPLIKERLSGLKDTYDEGGIHALTQSIKDLAKSNNRIELIEKRALQYESQSRTSEFISEAQRLRDEILSDPLYGGSSDLRDSELKRVNDLIHNLEHRLNSIKAQEDAKINKREEAATNNIELISTANDSRNLTQAQPTMENKFQKNQIINNNNSISQIPVQTSRDVPGMYRAYEVNA